jgi:CheY-like chemotaxis protein
MNGYDATRELRKLGGRFASLPVVAMTANALEGDERRCLEAGMTAYLPKPLSIDRLRDVLGACLPGETLPTLDAVAN